MQNYSNTILSYVLWQESKDIIFGVILVASSLIGLVLYWHCGTTKRRDFEISEARKISRRIAQKIIHEDKIREIFDSRRSDLIRIVKDKESDENYLKISEV